DPLHAALARRAREVARRCPVARAEVAVRARGGLHRVDEVVRGLDPLESSVEPGVPHEVAPHRLDALDVREPRRVARERAYRATLADEPLDQAPADVSGGSGDQLHGLGVTHSATENRYGRSPSGGMRHITFEWRRDRIPGTHRSPNPQT